MGIIGGNNTKERRHVNWPDYPKFEDIRFRADTDTFSMRVLDPFEYGCLMRIMGFIAAQMVWTYTPPSDDPKIKYSAKELSRICGTISVSRATKLLTTLSEFFVECDGYWRLKDPSWIEIAPRRGSRASMPQELRDLIRKRDGEVCAYCGSTDGPFEVDHLFPVMRGGSDDPSNLTIACEVCNRSKGSKILREWRQ